MSAQASDAPPLELALVKPALRNSLFYQAMLTIQTLGTVVPGLPADLNDRLSGIAPTLLFPAAGEPGAKLRRFAIAGEDRQWVWADAVIEGDTVRVIECRPMSATKRWRLDEVVERAR
jgi:hypothetical protein